jgi:hypothetical protein
MCQSVHRSGCKVRILLEWCQNACFPEKRPRRNVQYKRRRICSCSGKVFPLNSKHKRSHYTFTLLKKDTLTMNRHFSSTTRHALIDKDQDDIPTVVSQKVRDRSSRSEERVAPLVGKKRSRQDDAISECRGRSKIARLSLIQIQQSSTTRSL